MVRPDKGWAAFVPAGHDERRLSEVAVRGNDLIIGSHRGSVQALDARTGQPRWMYVFPMTHGNEGTWQQEGRRALVLPSEYAQGAFDWARFLAETKPTGRVVVDPSPDSHLRLHPLLWLAMALVAFGPLLLWLLSPWLERRMDRAAANQGLKAAQALVRGYHTMGVGYVLPCMLAVMAVPFVGDASSFWGLMLKIIFVASDENRPDLEFPLFQRLVAAGASRSAKTSAGQIALDLARQSGYPDEYLELLAPGRDGAELARSFLWLELPDSDELSRYAPIPVDIAGQRWPSSEHYFQAQRFGDVELRERIRAAKTVNEAFRISQEAERGTRSQRSWNQRRDAVMLDGLRARFTQHAPSRQKLLATRTAILVSAPMSDGYWTEGSRTFNAIGRMLMQLRAELG